MRNPEPSRELEPVFQAYSTDEVQLVASLLRANGFNPFVTGEPVKAVGLNIFGSLIPTRILVESKRADEARQLIKAQVQWLQPAHDPGVPDHKRKDNTITILILSALVFILWYFLTSLRPR